MIEIYKETAEKITFKLYVGGARYNSETAVWLSVVDVDGTVITSNSPATVETAAGIETYSYIIPLSATTEERDLVVTWHYRAGGVNGTRTEHVTVVTPYVYPDEIYDEYPQLAAKTYEEIKSMERRVRYIIDTICSQTFGKKKKTVKFYGTGEDFMFLNYRILSLDTMTANGIAAVTPLPFKVMRDGWGFRLNPSANFEYNLLNYDVKRDVYYGPGPNSSGWFTTGTYYELTGVFGWDSVPADINLCAKILVGDYFCPQDAWRQKSVKQTSAADFDFTFFHDQGTGNVDVDRILSQYQVASMVVI